MPFVGGSLLCVSALRSALGAIEREGTWSRLAFGAAVASVAVAGSGVFLTAVGLDGGQGLSDEALQVLSGADAIVHGVILPWGLAVFLTGASVVMLRGGLFARWLGGSVSRLRP